MPAAPPDPELTAEAADVLGTGDVHVTRLAHGLRLGVTAGVWRVEADGVAAVAKVVSPGHGNPDWRGSHDPHSYRYWQREPLVYTEGLPAPYRDAGIALPRLLGRFRRDNGDVSLWLEDVSGAGGSTWTLGQTRAHARRLGLAQGTCAVDGRWRHGPVPWSQDVLREYLDHPEVTAPDIDWSRVDDLRAWDSPLMRHFDADLRRDVLRLCRERYAMVRWGADLPHSLCHHDIWPNNLYQRDDTLIAIDWAFVGEGWLGTDIGNFVSDTALDLLRPADELPALDEAVFTGYCDGLRDAGWGGDPRLVRLGMCVMAAKWSWLIPVMLNRAGGEQGHTVYGSQQVDADRLYSERATVFRMLVAWAEEARTLAAEVLGDLPARSAAGLPHPR